MYPTCTRQAARHRLQADGPDRPTWPSTVERTLSDGLVEPTDQKVGGSSPSKRAYSSWSDWVSYGQRSLVGVGMTATASARPEAGRIVLTLVARPTA